MFQSLSQNLSAAFDKLKGKGLLSEEDVSLALREVRLALLDADVALPVAKDFIAAVKEKAVGQTVLGSINPAFQVIKIVQDELTRVLGVGDNALNLNTTPPAVILMCGLQGSGKTTSSAKLALRLKDKQGKKVMLASLDIYRPAAQEQLSILGKQIGVECLPIVAEEKPEAITQRALKEAKLGGYDVLILDTAGRLHVDDALMQELKDVAALANPIETLLVADSLTGQDAVNVATHFKEGVKLTGIILTRVDGDGRGGAALSMRQVTGCPIKFVGVGEKPDAFEEFHAERIASRILDKGDVVSLVEKAMENFDQAEAEKMAAKLKKGKFDFNDLADQLKQIQKMGGLGGIMGMLPGVGQLKAQMAQGGVDEKVILRQLAIISSMTKKERESDDRLFNGSRKRRIAIGSGTTVQEVNRLLKQQRQMADMMKKVGKMDKKALMRGGIGKLFG